MTNLPASEDWRNGGFGLYIHWPFCAAKCPYCDFNSHVVREIDQSKWAGAYVQEIARTAAETPGRILNTVFFGGGTPSLMHPDTVATVLDAVRDAWPMVNDPEITLEANPGSVEAGRFAGYRDAGVNRISMGIQALNDRDLQRLGRIHTVAEARAAFDIARACFDRVSFDLIYARQDQTLADWRTELAEAISMAVDHLSLYQLTIEDGTAFADRYRAGGLRGLPEDDLSADMYAVTQEVCADHGLSGYEVSNHARADAESRHNLIYWRYGDYIGIGPGAHGRVTLDGVRYATEAPKTPGAWLHAVSDGSGEQEREPLEPRDQAIEYLMMSLRLNEGLGVERFSTLSPLGLDQTGVAELRDLGLIDTNGTRLWATPTGRIVLNSVIARLLPD